MGIKQKEPMFYLQVELDFTEIPENDF